MKVLPYVIPALLFLAACKDTPDYVIDKAEMAELIADINEANIIVETNVAKYPSDSTKQLLKQSIFAKHNVTSEQFDTSLNWYGHNLELYAKIHDEAIEILEEKQKHLQDEARKSGIQIVAAGDSVNLWNALAYHLFKPEITGKFLQLSFSYQANQDNKPGDRFAWNLRLNNIRTSVDALVGVDYNDGTAEYISQSVQPDTKSTITLQTDSTKTVTRVYGYIDYKIGFESAIIVDGISVVRTRLNPAIYYRRNQGQKVLK